MRTTWLFVAVLTLLGMLAVRDVSGQTPARTTIPPEVLERLQSHRGVTYARYGERTLELDLFRPGSSTGRLPAIVCIHGGGWANGHRDSHASLAMALAARGYVAVTISYRLSGEAPFPAAIHDCKAAVRWLRAHADEYGVDVAQIGAIGLSAGGHLCALLATTANVPSLEGDGGHSEQSSAIQAAVPMGAQTDLESERARVVSSTEDRGAIWRQFLGGSLAERPEAYQLASPLHHLDSRDPPMHFITGGTDDESTRAAGFRARSTSLKVPGSGGLTVIDGAPHAFLGRQDWFDEAVEAAATFFDRTLKGPAAPGP